MSEQSGGKHRLLKRLARGDSLLGIIVLAVIIYVTLPPIIVMVWKSFIPGIGLSGHATFSAYRSIAHNGLGSTVIDTLIFAAGSALVSLLVGGSIAWAAVRTDAPAAWLGYVAAFVGFAVPGLVNIIGWIILLGNGSGVADGWLDKQVLGSLHVGVENLPAMIVIEGLLNVPIIFFLLIGPFRSLNASFEEAGQIAGGSGSKVLRKITLPLLKPALYSAIILMGLRGLQGFEVPVLLGIPARTSIFSARIYESIYSSILPDYSSAAAFGTVLVLGLVVLIWLETRATRVGKRFEIISSRASTVRVIHLKFSKLLPLILNLLLLAFFLIPCLYVVVASFQERIGAPLSAKYFTLSNYRTLWHTAGFVSAIRDTVSVAVGAAIATIIITVLASWVSVRGPQKIARVVNLMSNVPLVIPGVVLGFGYLLFYLYSPVPLFATLWAIVIAFVAMFIPYGIRYIRPALLGISSELEEAARISGASGFQVLRRIVLPLVASSVTGTGLYVFFTSFRELAMVALLVTAGTPLLSTMLLDQTVNGDLTVVSALGSVIFVVSAVVGLIAFRFIRLQRVGPAVATVIE